jgi:hypothetical protein
MFKLTHLQRAFFAACASALLAAPLAAAQDRDSQEISSYVLTDAGLAKYKQAAKKIAALPNRPAGGCDEDESSDSQSLDQVTAKFNAAPGVKAAIQSAGMTTREYVVFTFSIFQNGLAAWALTQPGGKLPAGTSKANVDFYNRHAADLQQLDALKQDDDCNADEAEDEPEPEE